MFAQLLLCMSLVVHFIEAYLSSSEAVVQTSGGLHHIEANNHFLNRNKRTLKTNFGPQSTYITQNGLTCLVCPPGLYRKSDCTANGTKAVCEPCPDGYYNNQYNIATSCALCSPYCIDKNAAPESTCNATADMTCRCKYGYFNHSKGSGEWICIKHSPCQPGTEVQTTGTPEHDTVCTMCEKGTFSPKVSLTAKCLPCSTCDGERKVKKACDETTDVICVSHDETAIVNIVVPVVLTLIVIAGIGLAVVCLYRKGKLNHCKKSGKKTDEDCEPYVGIDLNENTINERKELCCPKAEIEIEMYPIPPVNHNQTDDSIQNEVTWSQLFTEVSAKIRLADSIWVDFLRKLFSKVYPNVEEIDNKIDEVRIDHQHNGVKEQIYRCLVAWKKRAADGACLEDILQALDTCRMQTFSSQLKLKYASLYRRTDITEADDCLREQD
ncbi:tumor necrosis factor receptor superfamily member 6-like isoform X1 [Mytilus californianus]|uniref:tumor necrosis factor receptor superfamily member 6-like isoform X1 n=2 Tax=Mytilus californianus TaxID=6549 RepID=UPI00224609AE|nr:tumor necrosis factor receptor superfamily member 6-like isoform X1 [Mytilus californianus]XP_052102829.1 tumor necrosis factor receptor superfamily member 6-like isoform X1 [Mytilus californianus]